VREVDAMQPLKPYMQEQESRKFWSMRWVIVASFLQAAAVFYLGLSPERRAAIPEWVVDLWGVLELAVAGLAAVAAAVHAPGGVLPMPLGPAVMPGTLSANEAHVTAPAARHAPAVPEDAPLPPPTARGPVGAYTPHPATPASPNEPGPPAPDPPPDPDTTPIPIPPPPDAPAPAPAAPK
jgi:hypothetical protein